MMACEGSAANTLSLTEEQSSFLRTCEEEFKDRYTDQDPDYVLVKDSGDPPIVTPWYSKPRRNFDWANKRDDRNDRYSDRQYGSRGPDYSRNNRYANRQPGNRNDFGSRYDDRRYGSRSQDYDRNYRYAGRQHPYQRRSHDDRRDGGSGRS